MLPDENTSVLEEIEHLQARVASLEAEIESLKASMPSDEVVILRAVTREQAKQEIRELFNSGELLFYSDISKRLRIDLPLVVEICQELLEEGEIEIDANAV
jgi:hypothetical protein